jgi:hypothetical protein
MAIIGVLYSGSPEVAQDEIDEITEVLKQKSKNPVIEVPDWKDNLLARAKSLIRKKVQLFTLGASPKALSLFSQAWHLTFFAKSTKP